MSKIESVRSQIRNYLGEKAPLTAVTLDDLYCLPLITTEQRHSVRAAIYGLCAGTPVSERNKPTKYYGIRLKLNNGKQVILSLPGILRDDLQNDHESDTKTERIIQGLQKKYGVEPINYWGKSAQRRSVDQAGYGMRSAKKRDGKSCLLCNLDGQINQQPVSACHIISRKTIFWAALDEVDKTKGNIFSEEATFLLSTKLKDNELHSNNKYIVTLCREHNNMLLKALSLSLSPQESDEETIKDDLLFDV
jgi:hypothetical protein